MRVAIVHEWLTDFGGSEHVLEQFLKMYPEAWLFSVLDFVPPEERWFLHGRQPKTTFVQHLPFARKHFRAYLPLFPLAIEQLDLSGFDLIISSSHAVAKGVLTGPDQRHLSYVHSPMRYAWDLQAQYLEDAGLTNGPRSWLTRAMLHGLRRWDVISSNNVDQFVANSSFIARRIMRCYRREAKVVWPPVEVEKFQPAAKRDDFYLAASRMTPYKRVKLVVQAFTGMPERRLVVIGDGEEYEETRRLAGPNVTFLGRKPPAELADCMSRARALVFAGIEDFGIILGEAQAAGCPLIALRKGGAEDIVRGLDQDEPTGVFFDTQTAASITEAVRQFEDTAHLITAENCRKNAMRFAPEAFRARIKACVDILMDQGGA